jgi:hypothetical protein
VSGVRLSCVSVPAAASARSSTSAPREAIASVEPPSLAAASVRGSAHEAGPGQAGARLPSAHRTGLHSAAAHCRAWTDTHLVTGTRRRGHRPSTAAAAAAHRSVGQAHTNRVCHTASFLPPPCPEPRSALHCTGTCTAPEQRRPPSTHGPWVAPARPAPPQRRPRPQASATPRRGAALATSPGEAGRREDPRRSA